MSEIQELAAAIIEHLRPTIPVSVDLWGVAEIATYLKMSDQHVRQRVTCLPGFPQAIRIPSTGKSGHPRWQAAEIIKWTQSYKEKRIA